MLIKRLYKPMMMLAAATMLVSCGGAPAATPVAKPAEPTQAAATSAPTKVAEPTKAAEPTKGSEPTKAAEPTKALVGGKFQEAPILADMVKAGKLPPVEQRVPVEPFVVGPDVIISKQDLPDWQPGKYGGTLHTVATDSSWQPDIFMGMIENFLMAPGIGIEGLRPNILSDYKVSSDNKEFVLTLRKGLKWSDGAPVTTDDIKFTYEDVMLNDKLFPTFPTKFRAGGKADGEPMKLAITDDFTFKLTFAEPYGGLLRELAIKSWQTYSDLLKPKHFLMQFHTKYADPAKLQQLMTENKFTTEWWNLFNLKDCTTWSITNEKCIGFPVLYAYSRVKGDTGVMAFERNPYYFKVDTAGQQLPYIDRIIAPVVQDVEAANMRVLSGDVDLLRENTSLSKMPVYKENEAKGNYKITLLDQHVDPIALFFNPVVSNTNAAKVISDLRFRQAVSKALNRQEYIDNIYYGYASVPQTVDSTYDVNGANKLLDDMGMTKKDADGYRLGPDGKTFVLDLDNNGGHPDFVPAMELVTAQLSKVGIKVNAKKMGTADFDSRRTNNSWQVWIIWSVQPMWRDGTWDDYLPGAYVNQWSLWYSSKGKSGSEPPPEVKAVYKLNDERIAAVPASDAEKKITDAIYKAQADNVWYVPLVEKAKYPLVTSAKMGNVPQGGQAIAANASLEQLFFK